MRGHLSVQWSDHEGAVVRGDADGWQWLAEIVSRLAAHAEDFRIQHYDPADLAGPLAFGSERLDVVRMEEPHADSPFLEVTGVSEDVQITVDDPGLLRLAQVLSPPPANAREVARLEQDLRQALRPESAHLRLQWVEQW